VRQERGSQASAVVEATPPTSTTVSAPARLGFVDSLRALAALYVMASHIMLEIWPRALPSGLAGALAAPLFYGHQAVSVFIVLSGFSLMLPVARNHNRLPWGVWGFYWRRAKRILPPYYFAMGLALLLIWLFIGRKTGTPWDSTLPVTGQTVIEHILLIQDLSHLNPARINHVFWSIAMECQIYLLFPALVLLWRRYPPLFAMPLATLASFALMFALVPTWVGQTPGYAAVAFAPQYIGLFAMGMFAASLHTVPSPRWGSLRDRYLWDVVAVVCFGLLVVALPGERIYILDPLTGLMTVGVLLAASRPGVNPIRTALEWRPLVWIGGFSYSLYLIHAPLVQLIWQYSLHLWGVHGLLAFLALLLVGGPLIVAASWVFWYFCERPFLNSRPTGAMRKTIRKSNVDL
jgi:peptidoglycan/LPS O-acetylase OafA/YrhL